MDVLRKCLEVNPKKRPTMEEVVDHPWVTRNIFGEAPAEKVLPKIETIKEEVPK